MPQKSLNKLITKKDFRLNLILYYYIILLSTRNISVKHKFGFILGLCRCGNRRVPKLREGPRSIDGMS